MHIAVHKQSRMKGCGLLIKMLVVYFACVIITLGIFTACGAQHIYGYTAVKGTVTVKSGRARKEPSTKSEFAFGVVKDETVIVIGEEKDKEGNLWYKIKVLDSVGYLRSDLVKKTKVEVKSESTNDAGNTASNSNVNNTTTTATGNSSASTTGTSGNGPCVKGSNVIVREQATTKSGVRVIVQNGQALTINSTVKGDDGKEWHEVSFTTVNNNSYKGFIRSDLVSMSGTTSTGGQTSSTATSGEGGQTSQPQLQVGKIKGIGVNIRTTPVDGAVLGKLSTGDPITARYQVKAEKDGNIWYQISCLINKKPQEGFVRSDFTEGITLKTANNTGTEGQTSNAATTGESGQTASGTDGAQVGKIKGTGVNIRNNPVTGKVLGRLTTGDSITARDQVKAEDGTIWYLISCVINKTPQEGYVRSDFTEGITMKAESTSNNNTQNSNTTNGEGGQNSSQSSSQPSGTLQSASIKGIGVRVRAKAVDGDVVASLDSGYPIELLGQIDGSDDHKWYKIKFSKNDQEREGYVRSDLVTVIYSKTESTQVSDADFEKQIESFPEAYKASLRGLHEKYPSWQFVPVDTGLEWSDVVANESRVGKNLVSKTSIASWKSTEPQAYDWNSNTWYGFDGGSWAAASTELIQYYLDPRNFLDDSGIFQFETLEYQDYQSKAGVDNVVSGTFMAGDFTDTDGAVRNYAQSFYEAGQACGINPYHLASKAIQEQGVYGKSQSIAGNVGGLENLFNYFNIGAYAANGRTATINGLYYAAGSDETYLRPWNTRYRSIVGSAKYIADKYVALGQNTLYFQKFNVVNKTNGIYQHQYMSNIVAASYESARMRKAYGDLNTKLVFRIPIYNNMPATNCIKPTSDSNPNTYLSNLWVEGYSFSTAFSAINSTYYLTVPNEVTSVNVGATAVSGSSSVGGAGVYSLNEGENKIQVVCKAQNGNTKEYCIIVTRQ